MFWFHNIAYFHVDVPAAPQGRLPLPFCGLYSMTKHAATALADVLRMELKQWGITVHDLQPGFFRQVVSF
jgi:NAD(P)-dependent dehydrogenase (short-subunit alcohol dehydrogenase family)